MYTSHMIGEIPEKLYMSLDEDYTTFMHAARLAHKHGTVSPAILNVENDMAGMYTGKDIYSYLVYYGFSKYAATEAVRRLATNDFIIDELREEGYTEHYINYQSTYIERLEDAGHKNFLVTKSYAMKNKIEIRPIKFIAPPVVELVYRTSRTPTYNPELKKNNDAEIRIWFQTREDISYDEMVSELESKWEEALTNATELISDELVAEIDMESKRIYKNEMPDGEYGDEINREISEGEIIDTLDEWHGYLIFSKDGIEHPTKYPVL